MTDHLAVLEGIAEEILSDPCLEDNATYYADKITAAIALMRGQSWQDIATAPRDGTRILGWSEEFGARETYMRKFGEGSIGYANWKAGKGPAESGWEWHEPQSGWVGGWSPTHWSELSTPAEGHIR